MMIALAALVGALVGIQYGRLDERVNTILRVLGWIP
jgi:hypothetical protein